MWIYLEHVNNNNVNIYILYTCNFHAQNNILFILYISISIIYIGYISLYITYLCYYIKLY